SAVRRSGDPATRDGRGEVGKRGGAQRYSPGKCVGWCCREARRATSRRAHIGRRQKAASFREVDLVSRSGGRRGSRRQFRTDTEEAWHCRSSGIEAYTFQRRSRGDGGRGKGRGRDWPYLPERNGRAGN